MKMFLQKFSELVLRVTAAEEMLSAFSAVSVLNNSHAVIKVNLNRLLCFHNVMLSVWAGSYLFHSVRTFGESNLRMDHLSSKLFVALSNSLESYSFQYIFHWPFYNLLEHFLDRSGRWSQHVFLKLVENFANECRTFIWCGNKYEKAD